MTTVKAGSEYLSISSQGTVHPRVQSELIPEVFGRVEAAVEGSEVIDKTSSTTSEGLCSLMKHILYSIGSFIPEGSANFGAAQDSNLAGDLPSGFPVACGYV